jgi:DNA polymerase-4
LWGVGPKTEATLNGAGIETAGQLADADEQWLLGRLGPWALRWRLMAQGIDIRDVSPSREYKQASREITFDRDTRDPARLASTLQGMARDLENTIPSMGPAQCVHIKLRYSDFRTITRQRRTGALRTADEIAGAAQELLDQWWTGKPVRLLGIGLSHFVSHPKNQLTLFEG